MPHIFKENQLVITLNAAVNHYLVIYNSFYSKFDKTDLPLSSFLQETTNFGNIFI